MKQAECVYGFIYFVFISIYGYVIMKDEPYFPRALGGSGDYNLCTMDFPYKARNPSLENFVMISLAYHTTSLIRLFIE